MSSQRRSVLKKLSFRDCHLKLNIFCLLRRRILITELIDSFFLVFKGIYDRINCTTSDDWNEGHPFKDRRNIFLFLAYAKDRGCGFKIGRIRFNSSLTWFSFFFGLLGLLYHFFQAAWKKQTNKQTNKQTIKNRHHEGYLSDRSLCSAGGGWGELKDFGCFGYTRVVIKFTWSY